jgi:hypothetical protein
VAAVVAAVLLWPAPDPFAGVETVAIRVGAEPAASPIDFESELSVVLGDRSIRIVSDEASADAVLAVTDMRLNLGDVQISFTNGQVSGTAAAICQLTNVRTGKSYTMDFVVRIGNGGVTANLTPRKFWEVWRPAPRS